MNIQPDTVSQPVEVVRYRSPRYLLGLVASLLGIGITSAVVFVILANLAVATTEILIGLVLTVVWILGAVNFLFTIVQEIETGEDGLRMKCFPSRDRFFPWSDIHKLIRRTDVIIYRKGPVDFWPAYIPASYSSELEMIYSGPDEITRLVAVICQHARLSPKRKTLWGYDVYIRNDE